MNKSISTFLIISSITIFRSLSQPITYERNPLRSDLDFAASSLESTLLSRVNDLNKEWHFDYGYSIHIISSDCGGNPTPVPGISHWRTPDQIFGLLEAYNELGDLKYISTAAKAIVRILEWRDDKRPNGPFSDMDGQFKRLWRNCDYQYIFPTCSSSTVASFRNVNMHNSSVFNNTNNLSDPDDIANWALYTPVGEGTIIRPMTYLFYLCETDPRNDDLENYLNGELSSLYTTLYPSSSSLTISNLKDLVWESIQDVVSYLTSVKTINGYNYMYAFDIEKLYYGIHNGDFSYNHSGRYKMSGTPGIGLKMDGNLYNQSVYADHVAVNQQNVFAEALLYMKEVFRLEGSPNYGTLKNYSEWFSNYFRSGIVLDQPSSPYVWWHYKNELFAPSVTPAPNDVPHTNEDVHYLIRDYNLNPDNAFTEELVYKIGKTARDRFYENPTPPTSNDEYFHWWSWNPGIKNGKKISNEFHANWLFRLSSYTNELYDIFADELLDPYHTATGLPATNYKAYNELSFYVPFYEDHPQFHINGEGYGYDGIASGDFNDDGFDDIAVYRRNSSSDPTKNRIKVFTSNGECFSYWTEFSWGNYDFAGIAAGNIDNSNGDDIVVITKGGPSSIAIDHVQSFVSNSSGFTAGNGYTWIGVGRSYKDVAVGNFDGDSDDDIVIIKDGGTGTVDNMIKVFTNNSGSFSPGPSIVWGGRDFDNISAGNFVQNQVHGMSNTKDEIVINKQHTATSPNNMIKVFSVDGSAINTNHMSFIYGDHDITDLVCGDFNSDGLDDFGLIRETSPDPDALSNNNNCVILHSENKGYSIGTMFSFSGNSTPFVAAAAGNFNNNFHTDPLRIGDDIATIMFNPSSENSINNNLKIFISGNERMICDEFSSLYEETEPQARKPNTVNEYTPSHLFIYPNPSNGLFIIEGLQNDLNLEVFNSHGQSVFIDKNAKGGIEYRLDLSDRPPGIYIIKIKGDELGIYSQKLLLR